MAIAAVAVVVAAQCMQAQKGGVGGMLRTREPTQAPLAHACMHAVRGGKGEGLSSSQCRQPLWAGTPYHISHIPYASAPPGSNHAAMGPGTIGVQSYVGPSLQ